MDQKPSAIRSVEAVPKKRSGSALRITMSRTNRPPRMKRTGRPHQQIWLRPTAADYASQLRVHAAATLDEVMCQVTRASLSPSHYSFLQRPNRFDRSRAMLKLSEIFDRFRPAFALPVKRIAAAMITFLTLVQTSHHRPELFW